MAAIKKAVSKEELMQAEKRADRAVAALETVTEVAVAGDAAVVEKVAVSTAELMQAEKGVGGRRQLGCRVWRR